MRLTREAGVDAFLAGKYVGTGGKLEDVDQYLESLQITEALRARTKALILELLDPERMAKGRYLPKRNRQGK